MPIPPRILLPGSMVIVTGILCLYKPKDITSFGAVARVRRIFGEKKCGHTGTLDPMATGVLPVLLGGATRFSQWLPSHEKAYRASFRLGVTTDTLDSSGTILLQREVRASAQDVKTALQTFTGEITQIPPMYSALSVDGVRLYELARKGLEVEREARKVTVYCAALSKQNEAAGEYEIEVSCSAGTYIRSLVADLGEVLGCGAVLTALERTQANGFTLAQAVTLAQAEEAGKEGRAASLLLQVEDVLGVYPAVEVSQAQAVRFRNGGALDKERLSGAQAEGFYRVYAPDSSFLGLAHLQEAELRVKCLLIER